MKQISSKLRFTDTVAMSNFGLCLHNNDLLERRYFLDEKRDRKTLEKLNLMTIHSDRWKVYSTLNEHCFTHIKHHG
ncbi:DDE Tnp IS1595 domain-containing protein [Aphis craccivora]|uniref:DDE Tnp IS1595 domain-containing protein n=1 Tax=Aphis craccivora TaxID=307492 RepID=A0A6G0ZHG7_APHCR|nr:DDE Tnp IS1595 domain-containing protein [Aphis craccivora]